MKIRCFSRMTQIATRAFLLNGSLAIVLLILSGMAAADRQKIHIQFHIVGQKFVLPPGDIDDINTAVAGKFSTAAEKQWGFIEWTSQAPAPANAAKWDITLRLTTLEVSSDAGGISSGYIVKLEHAGSLGSRIRSFEQSEDNETIYTLGSIVPFQNADELGDDISSQLDRQLGVLLKSDDVRAFLQDIPIVEAIIAEESRIVVPVKIRELRSEADSVLDVKFVSGNSQTGHIIMQTAAEVTDGGEYHGFVIGYVTEVKVFPLIIAAPLWDPPDELSELINSASDVKVYMVTYSPSLAGNTATDGNVILEPDL